MSLSDHLIALLTAGKTVKFTIVQDGESKTYFSRDYVKDTHDLFDILNQKLVHLDLSNVKIASVMTVPDNFEKEIASIRAYLEVRSPEMLGSDGVELITRHISKFKPLMEKCFLYEFTDLFAIETETKEFLAAAKEKWKQLIQERQKEVSDILIADRETFKSDNNTAGVTEVSIILSAIDSEVSKAVSKVDIVSKYSELINIWPPTLYPKPIQA